MERTVEKIEVPLQLEKTIEVPQVLLEKIVEMQQVLVEKIVDVPLVRVVARLGPLLAKEAHDLVLALPRFVRIRKNDLRKKRTGGSGDHVPSTVAAWATDVP